MTKIDSIPIPDLYWLAGWLEGEGCFMPGPPSDPGRIRVTSTCTDRDVVQRAACLCGVAVCKARTPQEPHHKQAWGMSLAGSRAYELMLQIRPLMGERRRARIDEILADYTPPVPRYGGCGSLGAYKRGCRCKSCRARKHREYVERRRF